MFRRSLDKPCRSPLRFPWRSSWSSWRSKRSKRKRRKEGYAAAFAFASNRPEPWLRKQPASSIMCSSGSRNHIRGYVPVSAGEKGFEGNAEKLRLPFSQSNDIIVYCEVARGGGIFSPIRMNSLPFPCVDGCTGFFANCGVHENERNVIFSFFPTFVCFGETRLSPSMHDLVSTFLFSTIPG